MQNSNTQQTNYSETMEKQRTQSLHCVIPTERSGEGSLTDVAFAYRRQTSFRDEKQTAQPPVPRLLPGACAPRRICQD